MENSLDVSSEVKSVNSMSELDRIWSASEHFKEGAERIYLDHNATSPLFPSITGQIEEWTRDWGNPSSIHWAGRNTKAVLRESRKKVADLIGASSLEVIFTAGGSEANNLALKGVASERTRFITSKVEHPSVAEVFKKFAASGMDVQYVKINRHGELDWEHYLSLLNEDTALVSMMLANNETGSIFPVKKMAREAHRVGALFHTDAVQALGKIPLSVEHLGVDLATFSGHKFYSLKGVGVLFCRKGLTLERQIEGGGQERHRRAGTENLLAIRSLAYVSDWKDSIVERTEKMQELRDHMQSRIEQEIVGVQVNGGSQRLPNTLSLSIDDVDGESLLMNLDLKGFAVSTGAACSSGSPEPSPTLIALGLTRQEAQGSLRLSVGWGTRKSHIDRFVDALVDVVARLRKISSEAVH